MKPGHKTWMHIQDFICPHLKQNKVVKFWILDFFSAAQRFLIKFNPFFEVFLKVCRYVTSTLDQGLVYYSWSEHKAQCSSNNKANRVLSWRTGWQGISHICIPIVFKVLCPRSLLFSLLFLSFCTGIWGKNCKQNVLTLHVSSCDMPQLQRGHLETNQMINWVFILWSIMVTNTN